MNAFTRAVAAAAATVLAGCAGLRPFTPTWITATPFNPDLYAYESVGVLPVSVNPAYRAGDLPLEQIRAAVMERLARLNPKDVVAVALPEGATSADNFPYTAGRLADIRLADEQTGGRVGISVVGWHPGDQYRHPSIHLFIAFADSRYRDRKWALSKSWSADEIDEFPDAIEDSLGYDFQQLRAFLRTGRRNWLMLSTTSVSVSDPLLAVFSRDMALDKKSNSTASDKVEVTITAMHDDGLSSVEIHNPALKSERELLSGKEFASGDKPLVFFSVIETIPLAVGENPVRVIARARAGSSEQPLQVVRNRVPSRIHALVVNSEEQSAADGTTRVQAALTSWQRVSAPQAAGVVVTVPASRATPYGILDALQHVTSNVSEGDVQLLYLSGTVREFEKQVFLVPSTIEQTRFQLRALPLNELNRMLKTGQSVGIIDGCAPEMQADIVRESVAEALPQNWIANVSNCESDHDETLAVQLEAILRDSGTFDRDRNGALSSAEIVNALASQSPRAVVGRALQAGT